MYPRPNRRFVALLLLIVWLTLLVILYNSWPSAEHLQDEPIEILWWTNGMPANYDETRTCGMHTCRFTSKRQRLREARAILFYGSNLEVHDWPLPRGPYHMWALLHEESPRNVPYVSHPQFLQHFNYTATFSRHSDMPLTTQYLPQASDLSSLDYYTHYDHKNAHAFNYQLAPVVFLQSDCDTMTGREDYIRELMRHMRVDSYGSCLHNKDLPKSLQKDYLNNLYSPALLRFLTRYKFMIAIENGACEDYITEKFWRPLVMGVIPIYFGSPSIRDWQPHNLSAIHVGDYAHAGELAKYLEQLGENRTAYNAYMGHKLNQSQPIANQQLLKMLLTRSYHIGDLAANNEGSIFNRFQCFVCHRLSVHHSKTPAHFANEQHYRCPHPPMHVPLQWRQEPQFALDWRNMMGVGRCQALLLDSLLRVNRSFTPAKMDARLAKMVSKNLCN